MDKQLPTIKNFRAIEAEPERPEPWWKRYYSYAFFSLCGAIFSMGYRYWELGGNARYGDTKSFWRPWYGHDYLREYPHCMPPAEFQHWLIRQLSIAGVAGLVVAVAFCCCFEKSQLAKRRKNVE